MQQRDLSFFGVRRCARRVRRRLLLRGIGGFFFRIFGHQTRGQSYLCGSLFGDLLVLASRVLLEETVHTSL